MNRIVNRAVGVAVVLAFASGQAARANSTPDVSNVTASQRADDSRLVDINYNLSDADGDACTVWVAVSDDGGASYRVPARTFSGDIGEDVSPGDGKQIIWDAGADMPGVQGGNFKVRVFADDGNGLSNRVLVPAGWFPFQDVIDPENWVFVDTFQIDKYEITNQFYVQFLNNADPNSDHWFSGMEIDRWGDPGNYAYTVHAGRENYPIRYVSFYDAEAFAVWRSAQEGATYRLPDQFEWGKAAAWDSVENHYYRYGFHRDTISCPWCNYNNCTGGPMPVGSYDGTGGREDAHSFYGCYDMSGNVWEWTSTVASTNRTIRGGLWSSPATDCACTHLDSRPPSTRSSVLGFRLVLDPG